jgi:hypothetical protein
VRAAAELTASLPRRPFTVAAYDDLTGWPSTVWTRWVPLPERCRLHVLMLPDFDRADRIGSYWGNPKTRTFAELLIDCEEDRVLRGQCS